MTTINTDLARTDPDLQPLADNGGPTETMLPGSVLHYALRTREIVILDDAVAQSPFGADCYIRARQARSILGPLLTESPDS